MSEISAPGLIKMQDILNENNFQRDKLINISIGNDERIYCLFTEHHSLYTAIAFDVDWYAGEVYGHNLINFGKQSINIHFMHPVGENFLLLGARARLYKDGIKDENALIIDRHGNKVRSFCLGDGINNCIVDSQNNIITSYFDEGVFGNNGWYDPIGSSGIIKWSQTGQKLWEDEKYSICDCYAINIDEQDNLWFYYYTDFNLVKTDYNSDIVYTPNISGSHGFLLSKSQTALLFHKGYGEKGFSMMKKNHHSLSNPSDIKIAHNSNEIDAPLYSFRSSRAVFVDAEGDLFFLDWIYG